MTEPSVSDQKILEDPAAYAKQIKAIQDCHDDKLGVRILRACMTAALTKKRTIVWVDPIEKSDLQMLAKRFHVSLSRDITLSPHVYHFTLLDE
jgi:hypothetical protein